MQVVFGGTGFIGGAVAAALQERHEPFLGFGRTTAIRSGGRSGFERLALQAPRDRSRLLLEAGPPTALIIATGGAAVAQDRETLRASHLDSLKDALDTIPPDWRRDLRVIYTSSALVYGRRSSPTPIKESEPAASNTLYAQTKLACEEHLLDWGAAHGARPIVVRLFNVTGAGQRASSITLDIARQAAEVADGRRNAFRLRSSTSLLDLVLVKEAATGLLALSRSDTALNLFNLCSGKVVTAHDLVAAANRVIGRETPVSFESDEGPPEALIGCPERLMAATGWRSRARVEDIMQDVMSGLRDEAVAHG